MGDASNFSFGFQSHDRRLLKLFFQKLYHTVKGPNKRTALFDMSWWQHGFPCLGLGDSAVELVGAKIESCTSCTYRSARIINRSTLMMYS